MARTALTVTKITRDGAFVAAVAGTVDGLMFKNNGRTFIDVTNGGAATRTLTVVTTRTVLGLDVADLTVNVAAGATTVIGPFPPADFNNSGTDANMVYLNFPAGNEGDLSVSAYSL